MPIAKVNGIDLYYEIHGSGHPLVLIRGLGSNADHWYEQVPAFSAHYQTVVFDNRGIGRSEKPDGPFTISMMADDTVGLMDALQIAKAHVLGVSLGGLIAQQIALDHADRVDGLILCCTGCGGAHTVRQPGFENRAAPEALYGRSREAAEQAQLNLFAAETIQSHPEVVQKYLETSRKHPPDADVLMRQRQAVEAFDSYEELPRIKAATLILTGAEDALVPPENSRILAQRISGSRLEIVPGGGHQVLIEQSEAVNRIVLEFLHG